ncbi:MAG: hypothetical protein M3461_19040 [Pseudomonadota bacterium]|nr:hypothetical protein [Pseudomonadota bacterium]
MDILTIIFYVVAYGFALVIAIVALQFAWLFLPTIAGIWGAIWLWKHGHDNWAIIVGIAGLVLQGKWPGWSTDTSGYHWTRGKNTVYDKNGNVKGYIDKD